MMMTPSHEISAHKQRVKNDWELIEVIGKGTYGEVFKGKRKMDDTIVAIKVTDINQNKTEEMKTELAVFEKFSNHENIVRFINAQFVVTMSGTEQLWIITEYCLYGAVCDLSKKLIHEGSHLDESFICLIVFDTLKGLKYLHDNRIVHRDVKGSNILLNSRGNIKITDFGVSKQLKDEMAKCFSSVGTPFWMAPEVIACEQQLDYCYDNRCDIWSLGITTIELGDGDPPLADEHPLRALFKIPRSPSPTVKRPDKWTKIFLDFINCCLIKDYEKRPFADQLLEHEFCTKIKAIANTLRGRLLMLLNFKFKKFDKSDEHKIGRKSENFEYSMESLKTSEVQNLAQLENLSEETILEHLHERYLRDRIYTNIGDILIAINPFKWLGIYNENEFDKEYQNIKNGNPPPHVYSVARAAHLAVLHKRKNQCCVISGESGAGKTVTSNYLVEELAALGKHGNPTLVKKILQVNPLMEAFGNAATNINDNSSRFGKFLELSFNDSGDLIEAQLSEFLLEKSRVVYQSRGERNYHILYYLIAGLDYHRKLGNFDLSSSDKHRYLNTDSQTLDQFACTKQMQEKFLTVQKCFDIIGFTQEEVQSLYCILAAVIHLGDVEIVIDDSLTHHGERGCIKSSDTLNTVASLLCIEAGDLADALTSTSSVTRGETILRYNTVEQSCDCRDATAKALYSRLFSWIVKRINILLKPNSVTSPRNSYKRIGILDIFGFENLSTNSFEQLCINIANEQLQFYFNQHVFEWEFEEYAIEGIPLDAITFQNNRPVLEMFLQRPMGILALLDEESRFPRATVFSLVEKFCDNMNKNFFQKPKDSTTNFVIYHYAGKITYDANGFLEKNRDTISSDVNHLLHTSEDRLVRIIFQGTTDHIDEVRRKGSVSSTDSFTFKADGTMIESKPSWAYLSTSKLHLTMSVHFRNSLRSLMAKMIQAEPHFIRCIRPNSKNSPDLFDETKVMIQLRYTGVLETAKIRRQGYSERIQFSDFVTRYKCLVYYLSDEPPHDANTCRNILKKVGMETYWKIGKTKVFLKYFQVARLTFLLEEHRKNAIRLQRCSKAWLYKVRFKKEKALLVKAAIVIQRNLRGWLARKRCDYMKRDNQEGLQMKIESNPTRVQSGHVEEKRANEEVGRGYLARKRFEKLTNEHEKEEGEMKLQMIEMQKADDGNSEEDEGETALQDTKLFFFLAQVQMSTSDYVSLLHRTSYPVLFSLRQAATEKARKEASNQKLGSRERVLAVLDGTDDILQSKYHWAREQFESKIFRARTASERDRTSYEKDRRFPLNDEHDYDMKSRSSSLKLNESRDVEKKTDKLFSNLNDDQQLRKDIENDEEFHVEIRKNFRRNDRSKEYPLRSVMEGNKTMHSDKSHSPQFQWFTSSSAEADQLSYLARETSIPTEEKVHHQLHAWRKSSKQTHLPLAPLHQPYSYLQGAHIQVNKGDKEKVHQSLQPHAPVRLQHSYAQLARGRRSERAEVLVKELENDRNINLRNGHHKGSYLKEKGLRDSLTRVLPRTDVDIHSGNGTDISLAHEPVKDPRSSLAYQIESHLLAKKSKKNQRNDSFSRNPVIEAKAKRENRQDRNLTSIENSNRLSQLNGFSYGIQEDQKGMLQGLHLRKTGRLQMLVQD